MLEDPTKVKSLFMLISEDNLICIDKFTSQIFIFMFREEAEKAIDIIKVRSPDHYHVRVEEVIFMNLMTDKFKFRYQFKDDIGF